MKRKDLKKLSKKALIERLKTVKRENWELLGQVVQKDEKIGRLLAYGIAMDGVFSQAVRENLAKIERLQTKLAQYQAQFGELAEDEPVTPQERGRAERQAQFTQPCQNSDKE